MSHEGRIGVTREKSSVTSDVTEDLPQGESTGNKKSWQPPKLTYTGEAKDVVQAGGGKLSPGTGDSGDPRKPPGIG